MASAKPSRRPPARGTAKPGRGRSTPEIPSHDDFPGAFGTDPTHEEAHPSISSGGHGVLSGGAFAEEREPEFTLRPRRLADYVGQKKVLDNLSVFIQAARQRGEPLDHVMLCSPPGLGKTTLAHIIAAEMGVNIQVTSGPAVDRKGDLAGMLSNLGRGDVLFIDEIHRLNAVIEENLYPAMEDFQFDIVLGDGPHARSIKLPLQPFTLVGATTRAGLLTSPLRARFGIVLQLEFYSPEELQQIVTRSANLLNIDITPEGAAEISRRSRGTPRIANRLLRRVRDFAQVAEMREIDREIADRALRALEVDQRGLDRTDRRFLEALIDRFGGRPVGIRNLAAVLSEEPDTLEEVYEPYLMQQGLVIRTPSGRAPTDAAYRHLGRRPPRRLPDLFATDRDPVGTDEATASEV